MMFKILLLGGGGGLQPILHKTFKIVHINFILTVIDVFMVVLEVEDKFERPQTLDFLYEKYHEVLVQHHYLYNYCLYFFFLGGGRFFQRTYVLSFAIYMYIRYDICAKCCTCELIVVGCNINVDFYI